jgi:hypothetical protein
VEVSGGPPADAPYNGIANERVSAIKAEDRAGAGAMLPAVARNEETNYPTIMSLGSEMKYLRGDWSSTTNTGIK